MQKYKYLALLPLLSLIACGGGSDGGSDGSERGLPPTRPSSEVSGTGFDGLIIEGDVSVNDFKNAVSGNLLATATTDVIGRYSANIISPDTTIIVTIKNGFYTEEATDTEITLDPKKGHQLYATDYYQSGAAVEVSATFFTTLATGLTEYLVHRQGLSTEVAIEQAYAEIDAWAGFDTRRTVPLAVNDAGNASPLLTNPLKAGYVAAGISELTRVIGGGEPHTKFFSIGFIQVAYEDIKADGRLDGLGSSGNPLSYGTLLISGDTYRNLLATRLLQFVNSSNNKTSLDFDDLVSFANELNAYKGALFNFTTSPDLSDNMPTITKVLPSGEAVQAKKMELSADVSDIFGIRSVKFSLNGNEVATVDTAPYMYALNLAQYPNGIYELATTATNYLGNTAEDKRNITINNGQLSVSVINEQYNRSLLKGETCPVNFTLSDTTGTGVSFVKYGETVLLYESPVTGGAINLSTTGTSGNSCGYITTKDRLGNPYSFAILTVKDQLKCITMTTRGIGMFQTYSCDMYAYRCSWSLPPSC